MGYSGRLKADTGTIDAFYAVRDTITKLTMARMSIHGQSDSHIQLFQSFPSKPEESIQRTHERRLCVPGELLPGHELSDIR